MRRSKRTRETNSSRKVPNSEAKLKVEDSETIKSENTDTIANPEFIGFTKEEEKEDIKEEDIKGEEKEDIKTISKPKVSRSKAKQTKPSSSKEMSFKFTRNYGCKMRIGSHVAMSGGVSKSILNAMNLGHNSFAMFLKSPRRWVSPQISDKEAEEFKRLCEEYKFNPKNDILPHGSYFINLANPDPEKEEKAYGSFLDDLKRCEKLGIGLYNFHPGSDLGTDRNSAIKRLAKNVNRAISDTEQVIILLENMAGHGNLIGSKLEDLRDVIELVENKERVGVCVDTCHTFAAGFDIRTEKLQKEFWEKFDEIVGLKYLKAIHLNDSKAPLGANRDLHQHIGYGFLGLEPFRVIVNTPHLEGLPIVLETPDGEKGSDDPRGEEMKLLEWLIGKSADDVEVIKKAEELQKKGAAERKEQLAKYEKKQSKGDGRKQTTLIGLTSKRRKITKTT